MTMWLRHRAKPLERFEPDALASVGLAPGEGFRTMKTIAATCCAIVFYSLTIPIAAYANPGHA
ncbi:MAG: hypothetical protein AAFO75_10230, partial [Pseudomonadota bacterium]